MKKVLFALIALCVAVAYAAGEAKPASDNAMYAYAAQRLFEMATPIAKAPVIEDSRGCLWGLTDNNPSGVPTLVMLSEKGGKTQICQKHKQN